MPDSNPERAEDLPPDIFARLCAEYGEDQAPILFARLTREIERSLPNGSWARHLRCVIHLAGGDAAQLESAIRLCLTDPRDAIVAAEYERSGESLRRVRDFDRAFGDQEPHPDG